MYNLSVQFCIMKGPEAGEYGACVTAGFEYAVLDA